MASLLAYLKSKLLIPEEKEEVQEIQEDLTQRIIHYNAIKKLSKLVKPHIGVITNIGEAHLENFKNIKDQRDMRDQGSRIKDPGSRIQDQVSNGRLRTL